MKKKVANFAIMHYGICYILFKFQITTSEEGEKIYNWDIKRQMVENLNKLEFSLEICENLSII